MRGMIEYRLYQGEASWLYGGIFMPKVLSMWSLGAITGNAVLFMSSLAIISGNAACGNASISYDAGIELDTAVEPDAAIARDSSAPRCEFATVGDTCAYPPHVPTSAITTCFGADALALDPPVGTHLVFTKDRDKYELACTPDCGQGFTRFTAQQALAQTDVPGVPLIEVFCFSSIHIPVGVTVTADYTFGRAIAVLAKSDITVAGIVDVSALRPFANTLDATGGPGGYPGGWGRKGGGPCGGATGIGGRTGGGGGGGGHGGIGGTGGDSNAVAVGGAGGCTVPYRLLEGGSGGGGGGEGTVVAVDGVDFPEDFAGGGGGGALALITGTTLTVTGSIKANGAAGDVHASNSTYKYDALGGAGGGAGGTLVLAGQRVDVSGTLHVEGGNGTVAWGHGGAGANSDSQRGENGASAPTTEKGGSGGGGGGGYIRIFSTSESTSCAMIASPRDGCESGPLPTVAATTP